MKRSECKIIGLNIKVKNEYNNYLYKLFSSIDLLNYKWYVITDDCLYSENGEIKQKIFNKDIVIGQDFFKYISLKDYYMIFLDLKAYPLSGKYSEIRVFEDFLESECEIILLCIDSTFIEFYSKDKSILDKVYKNCGKFNLESVEYISVENARGRSMIAF